MTPQREQPAAAANGRVPARLSGRARQRREHGCLAAFSSLLLVVQATGFVLMMARSAPQFPLAQVACAVCALALNAAIVALAVRNRHWHGLDATGTGAVAGKRTGVAVHDEVTGLLNARSFIEAGARLLDSSRGRGKSLAVMVLSLAGPPNGGANGPPATGSGVIPAFPTVAPLLAGALPAGALVARLNDQSFAAAIIFDGGHPLPVDRIAERVLALVAGQLKTSQGEQGAFAKIGLAGSDRVSGGIAALLESASTAAEAVISSGAPPFLWHSAAVATQTQTRQAIDSGLRPALGRHEILPYFEQQIALATGQLVGLEVLARWAHPTRGLLAPHEFIAAAEQNGTIGDLSLLVMRQAFVAARDWDKALTLSVNLSPVQMQDPWIAQKIVMLLAETGFAPNRLEIEITEAALFGDLAMAQSIAVSMKNHGIAIALDDFGTGFSALAHLRAVPFDRIKADRSFVTEMQHNAQSAELVRALIGLGENLRLPVTAVGIETAEIEERLRSFGCVAGQGHLYGRPANAANTRRLIAERGLLRHNATPASGDARLAG